MERTDKHYTGLAGEYLVAGAMSLRGWMANLTSKNCPTFDIFVRDDKKDINANVQVKTIRGGDSFPLGITSDINKSNDQIRVDVEHKIKGPYVFVHIDKNDDVSYFILSRDQTRNLICDIDVKYRSGEILKRKRTKKLSKSYPMAMPKEYLKEFQDKWDNLWKN